MAEDLYKEIDENIRELVRVLNEFPGIVTTSSCGGHSNPKPFQKSAGEWEIFIQLEDDDERPSSEAWKSIQLISFAFTKLIADVNVVVSCADPFLNCWNDPLSFVLEGTADPEKVMKCLRQLHLEAFSDA